MDEWEMLFDSGFLQEVRSVQTLRMSIKVERCRVSRPHERVLFITNCMIYPSDMATVRHSADIGGVSTLCTYIRDVVA